MSEFASWLLDLVKQFWIDLLDFIKDAFITVLDMVLSAVLALINAIPAPSFLTGGLQTALNGIGSDAWFYLSHFKLTQAFAILGAAVAFRLARKALTLFQW